MSDDQPVACAEHIWVFTVATLSSDGTHLERQCVRCGSISLEGPDDRFRP